MDETYEILLGLRERYEAHHKLRYTDEALSAAAKFSSQYISDRFLPDKVQCRAPPVLLGLLRVGWTQYSCPLELVCGCQQSKGELVACL